MTQPTAQKPDGSPLPDPAVEIAGEVLGVLSRHDPIRAITFIGQQYSIADVIRPHLPAVNTRADSALVGELVAGLERSATELDESLRQLPHDWRPDSAVEWQKGIRALLARAKEMMP